MPFCTKTEHLPTQARDKHRESTQKGEISQVKATQKPWVLTFSLGSTEALGSNAEKMLGATAQSAESTGQLPDENKQSEARPVVVAPDPVGARSTDRITKRQRVCKEAREQQAEATPLLLATDYGAWVKRNKVRKPLFCDAMLY